MRQLFFPVSRLDIRYIGISSFNFSLSWPLTPRSVCTTPLSTCPPSPTPHAQVTQSLVPPLTDGRAVRSSRPLFDVCKHCKLRSTAQSLLRASARCSSYQPQMVRLPPPMLATLLLLLSLPLPLHIATQNVPSGFFGDGIFNLLSMVAKKLYDVNFDGWSSHCSSWNCSKYSAS